jgi:nicotinamide riboside transporter PnuC
MLEIIKKHPIFMSALLAHLVVSAVFCGLSWYHWSNETGIGSDAEARQTKCLVNSIAWTVSLVVIILCLVIIYGKTPILI